LMRSPGYIGASIAPILPVNCNNIIGLQRLKKSLVKV
jgi:hypothetical protein